MTHNINEILDGNTSIMDKLLAGAKVTVSGMKAVAIEGAEKFSDVTNALRDGADKQAKALVATVVSVIGNFANASRSLMDTLSSSVAQLQPALAPTR